MTPPENRINDIADLPFARLWAEREHYPANCAEAQRFWDLRADEFNEITHAPDREERGELVAFLEDRGALRPGNAVLDLGCGAGRFSLEFARRGLLVTGLDISPKMIAHAKANVRRADLPGCRFLTLPWEKADARTYAGAFDLVFANMSAAVHDEQSLMNFHAASRGHCFLSGFIHRFDLLRQELADRLLDCGELPPHPGSVYFAFNILWQHGLYADCLCRDSGWTHAMGLEACVAAYAREFAGLSGCPEEEMEALLRGELAAKARDGLVERRVRSKVAWLWWKA